MRELLDFSKRLLALIEADCEKHGFKLELRDKPFIMESNSSGLFDDTKRVLSVATYKPLQEWVTTLAHEYCHLTQFVGNTKPWRDLYAPEFKGEDATCIAFSWLDGKEYPEEVVDAAVKAVLMLEFDCEQKTVALLRFLDCPLDLIEYNQKAMAYVFSYHAVRKYRKWYDPLNPPYANPEIWPLMPRSINVDPHDAETILQLADFTTSFPKEVRIVQA